MRGEGKFIKFSYKTQFSKSKHSCSICIEPHVRNPHKKRLSVPILERPKTILYNDKHRRSANESRIASQKPNGIELIKTRLRTCTDQTRSEFTQSQAERQAIY